MSGPVTTETWRELIAGDIEWLFKQPVTLERAHILQILRTCQRATTQQYLAFEGAVTNEAEHPT